MSAISYVPKSYKNIFVLIIKAWNFSSCLYNDYNYFEVIYYVFTTEIIAA